MQLVARALAGVEVLEVFEMIAHPIVMKFGGTSLKDACAFRRVRDIVNEQRFGHPVVITSAMSRITDALLICTEMAAEGTVEASSFVLDELLERHLKVARTLLTLELNAFVSTVENARQEISRLLCEICAHRELSPALQDEVVSYGECLAATLLTDVLLEDGLPAKYVDARQCIIINDRLHCSTPLLHETRQATRTIIEPLVKAAIIPVLGGFIGSTLNGVTATLGRGGSDYSAALVGAAVSACEVQIWTDVTGVMTADPRVVETARTISRLSYSEATSLAKFGVKVLHPKTVVPLAPHHIPLRIRNSLAPEQQGTLVYSALELSRGTLKAIICKTGVKIAHATFKSRFDKQSFKGTLAENCEWHRSVIEALETSNNGLLLLLDNGWLLHQIIEEMRHLGTVEMWNHGAVICAVGEGLGDNSSVAARIRNIIGDVGIELLCQSETGATLFFAVDEEVSNEALMQLHKAFLEQPLEVHGGI